MPRKMSDLTIDDWDDIERMLQEGWRTADVAKHYKVNASSFRGGIKKRNLRLPPINKSVTAPSRMQIASLFPTGPYSGMNAETTDPAEVLVGVQSQLLGLSRIYMSIMIAGEDGEPVCSSPAERNLANFVKNEGVSVKDYISLMKHVYNISIAHLPYRHAKLATLAVNEDGMTALATMSPDDKVKEFDRMLREAGIVATQ